MQHMPTLDLRNVYYWYYATQVLHNYSGTDWDTWNRAMRNLLIDTQVREGCATGVGTRKNRPWIAMGARQGGTM